MEAHYAITCQCRYNGRRTMDSDIQLCKYEPCGQPVMGESQYRDFCKNRCYGAWYRTTDAYVPPPKDALRSANLKHRYGIDLDQWNFLYDIQGGNCALCTATLNLDNTRLIHVDHDHSHSCSRGCVDCIRGLLCHHCNRFMGCIDKNELLLDLVDSRVHIYRSVRAFASLDAHKDRVQYNHWT